MGKDAFARKYRPKKLADLVGQEHVVKVLLNSLKQDDYHHAYIFAGKFGCGKTSTARIFAAAVNNPDGASAEPDLESELVKRIFEGKHPDIKEIDAAASGSIDGIRDLKEQIKYAPMECKYRFVILDEAHRLSGAAAEAALKMIEEPPANVIFILCTTDPQKLKDTIHSRCLPLRFNALSWNQAFQYLCKVADAEKIDYDEAALKIAARKSKGSARNALQNLQMLITFAGEGNKITTEIAQQALSAIDENFYFHLVDAIVKPDAGEAMRIVDKLLADGRDVGEVLDGLVGHLRNLLVITTAPSTQGLIYLTDDEQKRYMHQRNSLPSGLAAAFIIEALENLAETSRSIQLNLNPQVMLEGFVVKTIMSAATLRRKDTSRSQNTNASTQPQKAG